MLLFFVIDQIANVKTPNDVTPSDETIGLTRKKENKKNWQPTKLLRVWKFKPKPHDNPIKRLLKF
jgi:hypothetical protein